MALECSVGVLTAQDARWLLQARQKRHSTTEEALGIAARMGAYRVILTHFSNRYPKACAAPFPACNRRTLLHMPSTIIAAHTLSALHACGVHSSAPCRTLCGDRGCSVQPRNACCLPSIRLLPHAFKPVACRATLCTHAQVPLGLPGAGQLAGRLGIAYDGMRVPLAMLPRLPCLLPAIVAALGDGEELLLQQEGAALARGGDPGEQDVDIEV